MFSHFQVLTKFKFSEYALNTYDTSVLTKYDRIMFKLIVFHYRLMELYLFK